MSISDTQSAVQGFVAELPSKAGLVDWRPAHVAQTWRQSPHILEAEEAQMRVHARRQALALMVASSVLSVLAMYGIWTVLHGVI